MEYQRGTVDSFQREDVQTSFTPVGLASPPEEMTGRTGTLMGSTANGYGNAGTAASIKSSSLLLLGLGVTRTFSVTSGVRNRYLRTAINFKV